MIFATAIVLYVALVFFSVVWLKQTPSEKGVLFIIHSVVLFFLTQLFLDFPAYLRKEHIETQSATVVGTHLGVSRFSVYLEDGRQYGGMGIPSYNPRRDKGKILHIYTLPRMKLVTKLEVQERDGSHSTVYNIDHFIAPGVTVFLAPLFLLGLRDAIRKKKAKVNGNTKRRARGDGETRNPWGRP